VTIAGDDLCHRFANVHVARRRRHLVITDAARVTVTELTELVSTPTAHGTRPVQSARVLKANRDAVYAF
jgi:hypothetical protein